MLANIRGGGEFGPKWHQAALQENRHKSYGDFIAVEAQVEESVLERVSFVPLLDGIS